MKKETPYSKRYIVDEAILSEAILKTAQTKELLARAPELTINEAVKRIGLSRSAFYKYRDGIFPFYEATKEKIITIQIDLDHQTGVLSSCLACVAKTNANILTINQGLPLQGVARATISFEELGEQYSLEELLDDIYEVDGVRKVEMTGQN